MLILSTPTITCCVISMSSNEFDQLARDGHRREHDIDIRQHNIEDTQTKNYHNRDPKKMKSIKKVANYVAKGCVIFKSNTTGENE